MTDFRGKVENSCGTEYCPHCDMETDFKLSFKLDELVCEETVMIRCEHCSELQHPCSICEGCETNRECLDQILEGLGYKFEPIMVFGNRFCKITGYFYRKDW